MTLDSTKSFYWLKHSFKYIVSFGLSGVFLYAAFYNVDFNKVFDIIANASVFWLIIFILVFFFSHYLRALRWKYILSSVKRNTSMFNLFGALMVGYGVNCVVPRLGEVSRAVVFGRAEKLSRSSMFGTVIVERVIDILFLGLAVFVSVIIWTESLYDKFPWLKSALTITLFFMLAVFVLFFLVIKYKKNFYTVIIKMLSKISEKAADKTAYIFDMLVTGFTSLKGTKNYVITFFLSALIMIIYAFNAYIGFFMLGMENVHLVSYAMAWVLMSISAIGIVIPTPGGTGSYHILTINALMLLFGFGRDISTAYAILTHIISYVLFIVAGLIFFFLMNKQHENLLKIVETEIEEL